MQICLRPACKIAREQHAKLPAFAGKNTCKFQAKILKSQLKILTKRRQKTANPGKNTRTISSIYTLNSTQNHLQLQEICYHTAGKFTCKLQVN